MDPIVYKLVINLKANIFEVFFGIEVQNVGIDCRLQGIHHVFVELSHDEVVHEFSEGRREAVEQLGNVAAGQPTIESIRGELYVGQLDRVVVLVAVAVVVSLWRPA